MDNLTIDQTMLEENKINRFLNMLAIQYDGNLARQFELYYLKKCKKINELEEKINNTIEHIDLYTNRLLNNDIAITPIEMEYLKKILKGE